MAVYRDSQLGLCVDIRGPDGNAWSLMGIARNYSKQLGRSQASTDLTIERMMSGDYRNLVEVFEERLGNVITVLGKDEIFGEEE